MGKVKKVTYLMMSLIAIITSKTLKTLPCEKPFSIGILNAYH